MSSESERNEADEYVLGRDVTHLFRSKQPSNSAVVSFRVSSDELRKLSLFAEREGKSISQVLRDAIAQMPARQSAGRLALTCSGGGVAADASDRVSGEVAVSSAITRERSDA